MHNRFISDGIIADLSVFETLNKKDTASVLICSDIHHEPEAAAWILSCMPFDVCLFAGDGVQDILAAAALLIEAMQPYPPVIFLTRGNCDIARYTVPRQINTEQKQLVVPLEQYITIAGVPILLTHGHEYNVKLDTVRLRKAAQAAQCAVAVYGHTHQQAFEQIDGITCINGGSPCYPRKSAAGFAHLTIHNTDNRTSVDFYELDGFSAADFSIRLHTSYPINTLKCGVEICRSVWNNTAKQV